MSCLKEIWSSVYIYIFSLIRLKFLSRQIVTHDFIWPSSSPNKTSSDGTVTFCDLLLQKSNFAIFEFTAPSGSG